jgi:hypothetical protein
MAVEQNGFQRGHKVRGGKGFHDVTLRAGEERSAHYFRGGVLSEEQYPDFGRHLQNGYVWSSVMGNLNCTYLLSTNLWIANPALNQNTGSPKVRAERITGLERFLNRCTELISAGIRTGRLSRLKKQIRSSLKSSKEQRREGR